jgi:hypothetical protein
MDHHDVVEHGYIVTEKRAEETQAEETLAEGRRGTRQKEDEVGGQGTEDGRKETGDRRRLTGRGERALDKVGAREYACIRGKRSMGGILTLRSEQGS